MSRFFAEIAYQGTNYAGWQRQPNALSVQEVIEDGFSTVLNTSIPITGCGRTDTGVHASQYFFHFDFDRKFPDHFIDRINKFLPKDISVYRVIPVNNKAHARFDAIRRSYEYRLDQIKNPFEYTLATPYWSLQEVDLQKMNEVASMILNYKEFKPFCKTHSDAKTAHCDISESEWIRGNQSGRLVYKVSSDRFLRGMIRLIVGCSLNYAEGKIALEDIKNSLDTQQIMPKSRSAPAEGLYLSSVKYPYL